MKRIRRENLLYLVLCTILVTGGYVFFRYAYRVADELPFSQEIVLVALGTIVTVLITALLLNKQTEVELAKEENIKFLDLKTSIYMQLLDHIEAVLLAGHSESADLTRLRFLTHKLSLVARPEVLMEFESFVETFCEAVKDGRVVGGEADEIQQALASLTVKIRGDLVGSLDEESRFSKARISDQIQANTRKLSLFAGLKGRTPPSRR